MLRAMHRAVILLALAACTDPDTAQLAEVKGKVCACPSSACAEQAMNALPKHNVSNHRTQQLAHDMMECLWKLHEKERPKAEPDQEPEAKAP